MVDLPRSRALVAFDRNGFLLPIDPVTPPGSKVWRLLHRSPVLVMIGAALFLVAIFASDLATIALQVIGLGQRGRYAVPLVGTAVVVASYYAFVRLVERRRHVAELALPGAPVEAVAAAAGGIALFLLIVAVASGGGHAQLVGLVSRTVMLPTLVVATCGAVVQEIIMRAGVFRLLERLAGTWLALVVSAIGLAIAHLTSGDTDLWSVLAASVQNGVLFAAAFIVTRRLWASIGLHIGWNIAMALLIVERRDGGSAGGLAASWPGILIAGVAAIVLLVVAMRRSRIVAPAWTRHVVRPSRRTPAVSLG